MVEGGRELVEEGRPAAAAQGSRACDGSLKPPGADRERVTDTFTVLTPMSMKFVGTRSLPTLLLTSSRSFGVHKRPPWSETVTEEPLEEVAVSKSQ